MTRIFLLEDDKSFGEVLKAYLKIHEFDVFWVQDGQEALDKFDDKKFDFCILDVMLPHIDGFSVAAKIREMSPEIPFIFLTAKTLKEDELKGYELGADDYIKKPFDSEVLIYKIKAILGRKSNHQSNNKNEFEIGKFHFQAMVRELTNKENNELTKLSPKEGHLLQLLLQNQGNILERKQALTQIWGDDNYFTTRSMDVYITKLRKYLKLDARIQIINIHGSGYRLVFTED
ncbi:MAG: response regulator [Bacteroidales bacterium]|nr:response regulator [Bacteroidales bacterium]